MSEFYIWQTITPEANVREAPNLERTVKGIHTIDGGSRPLPVWYVFRASASDYSGWSIIDRLLYLHQFQQTTLFSHYFYCACTLCKCFPHPFCTPGYLMSQDSKFSALSWWLLNPGLRPKANFTHFVVTFNSCLYPISLRAAFYGSVVFLLNWLYRNINLVVMFTKWNVT